MQRITTKIVIDMESGDVLRRDSYLYEGPVELCCGPTSAETGLQAQSQGMAQTLQNSYSTLFGQQQGTLANLNAKLGQIATGTTGPGFSGAENASNISQIQNTAAGAAKNADQATMDAESGQGSGGGSALRSGVQAELKEQTDTGAANQESNALLENTQQNYKTGRENAEASASGFANLAGEESPNSAAQSEISSNNDSFGQAQTIQQQDNALAKDIAGGVTSLAGSFLTGGMSGLMGGGGTDPGITQGQTPILPNEYSGADTMIGG